MPHIHEKFDFCSDVFVVYKNKVLVRKHEKYNNWTSVGGHVELNETPDMAAIREVKEEVGLDIRLVSPRSIPEDDEIRRQLIPPWYVRVTWVNEVHSHIDLVYFALSETDIVVPEKTTDEWQWLSLEDLNINKLGMSESILFYAKEALKELGRE